MDSGSAVCAADVTTTPWAEGVASKRAETEARCAIAVAEASAAVQRAQTAAVAARAHLRRAQDVQKEAKERLRRLEQASAKPGFLPYWPAQEHA